MFINCCCFYCYFFVSGTRLSIISKHQTLLLDLQMKEAMPNVQRLLQELKHLKEDNKELQQLKEENKEQQEEIKELKKDNKELKEEIKELKAAIAKLTK